MKFILKVLSITLCLMIIPVSAVVTAAIKQRFEDGPNRVFAGGPLVSGTLYEGEEPDWTFVNQIPTVELQLLEPPQSRRIWIAEAGGRLFVWSGYMNSLAGKLWKRWPAQAEANGKAIIRINGKLYERHLRRITQDPVFAQLSETVSRKYPSRLTIGAIEREDVWIFEAEPRPGSSELSIRESDR